MLITTALKNLLVKMGVTPEGRSISELINEVGDGYNGSNEYVVTLTTTKNSSVDFYGEEITADKTATEIKQAVTDGKTVKAVLTFADNVTKVSTNVQKDASGVSIIFSEFAKANASSDGTLTATIISVATGILGTNFTYTLE